MQSPLPVRDGVNATRLRLPDEGPWDTAMDYMMHRWGHIDPQGIEDRFDAGEIVGEAGVPLDRTTPLRRHTFIWYYRTLPPEDPDPGGAEHPAPGRPPPGGGQAALPADHPGRDLHPGIGPGAAPEPAAAAGPDPDAPAGPDDGRASCCSRRIPKRAGKYQVLVREAPGAEGVRVRVRGGACARALPPSTSPWWCGTG